MKDTRLSDRWWRLNNLYYIIDETGKKIKFKPKDREVQAKLYSGLWYLNEILKSRQHGITTFFCIFFLDACLFKANTRAGIIAHNMDDASSFFQDKVKYAYDNIEIQSIKDMRKADSDSARELKFSNNSAIRVGTSLRSATLQYLLISEYGKICAKYPEKAKEIRTGALNTVHAGQFIAIESTAEGMEGHYYELDKKARDMQLTGSKLTKMDFKHFFFPWWKKPEYSLSQEDTDNTLVPDEMTKYFDGLKSKHGIELTNRQKAWYTKKYDTQQDEMKREFPSTPDEAFEAAVVGAYYSTQMSQARKDGRINDGLLNPNKQVHTAWDLGIGASEGMTIVFFQVTGQWVDIVDYVSHSGEGMEYYKIEMDKKDYIYGKHFAPHDINKRDIISGKNRIARAKEDVGIDFERIERAADVVEDINEVRRMFYRFRFVSDKCSKLIKCMDAYRKEWNKGAGCFRRTPLGNWASHGADGARSMVHGVLSLETDHTVIPQDSFMNQGQGSWMVG